jgi:hypothetical protein
MAGVSVKVSDEEALAIALRAVKPDYASAEAVRIYTLDSINVRLGHVVSTAEKEHRIPYLAVMHDPVIDWRESEAYKKWGSGDVVERKKVALKAMASTMICNRVPYEDVSKEKWNQSIDIRTERVRRALGGQEVLDRSVLYSARDILDDFMGGFLPLKDPQSVELYAQLLAELKGGEPKDFTQVPPAITARMFFSELEFLTMPTPKLKYYHQ